jgi:hypothetical protein
MPLITITPPTPAESLLLAQSERLDSAINIVHMATVESFREFWHGDVTPAELLQRLGTNAVKAFETHASAVAFLIANGVTLEPEDYMPPVAYTEHDDGSITLNPTKE